MVHLVSLGDYAPLVLVFDLAHVQLMGEVCDMCVGHVSPQIKEICLDGKLLLCCDDVPRLDMLDHCLYGLILLTHVFLFELFIYCASTAVMMALTAIASTTS